MQESEWESKVPILQAREALRRVDYAGNRFWGANLDYSRKRTVEDIIVSRYYSEVRLSLLGWKKSDCHFLFMCMFLFLYA